MSRTPTRQAAAIYSDAHVIASSTASALTNLDQAKGGYPTGHEPTPTLDDDRDPPADRAVRDETALREHLRQAEHHARNAAAIALRWATWNLDGTNTRERLATIDADIWCSN